MEPDRQDLFKSTLARFNRIYSFITQVCRLFDKELHRFSVYARFLYIQLPKGPGEQVDVDDKVLLQIQNDYAAEDKWHSYARNNDFKTFMLLFEKDFLDMAAQRYEQSEAFFVKLFTDPDMLKQVMGPLGGVLYERLKRGNSAGNVC